MRRVLDGEARALVSSQISKLDEQLASRLDAWLRSSGGLPAADRDADEIVTRVAAGILRDALAARRGRGLGGWHVKAGQNKRLQAELIAHAAAGSLVDVLRLAVVIHARAHLFGTEA